MTSHVEQQDEPVVLKTHNLQQNKTFNCDLNSVQQFNIVKHEKPTASSLEK